MTKAMKRYTLRFLVREEDRKKPLADRFVVEVSMDTRTESGAGALRQLATLLGQVASAYEGDETP